MKRGRFSLAILIGTLSCGGAAMADPTRDVETRNRAVIEASFEAWRQGTGGPFDLLSDDVSWTVVGRSRVSKTCTSREAFMSEVIQPFNARMRGGLRPNLRKLCADGDTVIVFFDASGTSVDGRPYENTYAWFLELDDGKIARAFAFLDSIAFNELWDAGSR
jgi:ketosteroid isomerase-like protein